MDGLFPGSGPIWLSIRLAGVSTACLLVVATPLAWWLARTASPLKPLLEATVALPLVLPPTVLGFYLLILLGPHGWIGRPWLELTGTTLTFSFIGLVIASIIYSFPFVVQPIQNAFELTGRTASDVAQTLGASPLDSFFTVAIPLASRGFLSAIVLGFAHTLGEFGVVLMVGGNIPRETRVISIAIFDQVETLNYAMAHKLSIILLAFSFAMVLVVYVVNRKWRR